MFLTELQRFIFFCLNIIPQPHTCKLLFLSSVDLNQHPITLTLVILLILNT